MSFGKERLERYGVARRLLSVGFVAIALAPIGLFATATAASASTTATSLSFSTQPSPTYSGRDTVVVSVLAASGPNPTSGTVTASDSFDDLNCTVDLSGSNQASCQSPDSAFTEAGSDTIAASYGGTSSFGSSVGSTTITVAKASVTLSATASAATVGETTTVTVQASPSLTGNTTGALSVTDTAGVLSCSTTIANGTSAECTSSAYRAITNDSITVTWAGNADYNAASTSTSLEVGQASTVVESVTASPTQVGQTATITAQVEPPPDGGYVDITDADDQVTTCTSVAVDAATGEATCTTNTLSTADASDTLHATYLGDANYAASTVTTGTLDVQRGATQLVVTADPSPSAGSTATYVATLSPTTAASGAGTISFSDTANEITDCASQVLSSSSGAASCTSLTYPSVGSDQVTASYGGSSNWAPSSSSASFTTTQGSPNVAITVSPSNPTVGETATITAVVTPSDGGGTVDFFGSYLGSNCSAVPLAGDSASCTTSTFTSVGNWTANATYSGDTNYSSAGSFKTISVAQAPTTVVVTASVPSPYAFAADTLVATVSPVPDGGTVNFTSSGSAIPGCSGVAVNTATGEAACPIASLPGAGSYAATASYSGDANYAGYTGQLIFSIAKIPTSIVVTASLDPVTVGQATTLTVTVSPVPDSGTVTVADADGDLTCSGISIATSGAGAGTATCATRILSPAGSDSLAASFSGTSNYTTATGSSSITISRIASTTSLSSEDAYGVVGEELHVAVIVSPIPASGTVDFSDALNQLGICASVPVNSSTGIASCTSGVLTGTGPDLITATLQQTAIEAASSVATTIAIDEQPAISGSLTVAETAGSASTASVAVSGYPAPTVTTTAAMPSGLVLDANGAITGSPAYGSGGVYAIPVSATNTLSSVGATATIVVGQVPAITSPTELSALYGQESTFQFDTAAGTYPVATFALSGATPAGMTFTDNGDGTATVSGTPSDYVSGAQSFRLIVSNSVGSIAVPVTIDVTGTPSPPGSGQTTPVVTTTTSTGGGSNGSTLSPLAQAIQAHVSSAVPSSGVEPKVTEKGALPATYDPIARTRVVRKDKSKVSEPIVRLGVDARFPTLDNDGPYGDCAVVADSNIVRVDHLLGKIKSVPSMTTNEALSEWSAINGGTGAGLTDSQFLHAWSGPGGLLGTRIRGWRLLDPHNVAAFKKAIKASGAIYAGIVLPSAGVVGTTIDPKLSADSEVAGHGLAIFGWTPSGFLGISWGEVVLLPYAWWRKFSTTAYAVNLFQPSARHTTASTKYVATR